MYVQFQTVNVGALRCPVHYAIGDINETPWKMPLSKRYHLIDFTRV